MARSGTSNAAAAIMLVGRMRMLFPFLLSKTFSCPMLGIKAICGMRAQRGVRIAVDKARRERHIGLTLNARSLRRGI
ncbi:protein of unknown function [Pseudorhizobium banfieldiae]|uniref:Uncharacterized protein n=1 Tax=Pseudorhizobium banfieldiae TaxID=1125847 RepID=L0NFK0_9HYPH|nr:protein of unknown function [Pseudorhizobium banfieldiae]